MIRNEDQSRFGIYRLKGEERVNLADVPELSGVGLCLATLREEGEITDDDRVGLLDREARRWIVNPWAVGR